jgi:drug/metabolite transporter (DMT)-like permease
VKGTSITMMTRRDAMTAGSSALPFSLALAVTTAPASMSGLSSIAWVGLAYVSVFSMFVGFVFWYRALAIGGSARIGQLQLLQPFFGIVLAWAFLGEQLHWSMFACAGLIVACVVAGRRYV